MAYIIGSKYIEYNWKNWVQGMTSSNLTEDGGFAPGPFTDNTSVSTINPMIVPGQLNFPAVPTDKSTDLVGQIIMSCEDAQVVAPKTRCAVSTSGKFYTVGGTGTLTLVDTDATRSYIFGKSDMASCFGYIYGTSATYAFEWVPSSGAINQTYYQFSATYSNSNLVPHPVLVYENNLYYGNGNILLRQTASGGVPAAILTLEDSQVIQALGIDPGTGKMMISTFAGINISASKYGLSKILFYDGYSNKPIRSVIVDDMVTSFFTLGGTVFIGYGNNFGYWTGTGISFMRQFRVGLTSGELLYKHHITNIDHVLYIVEKNRIMAFGEVMQGQGRSWWYAFMNAPGGTATDITCVFNLGNGILCYSYSSAKFFTLDTTSVATIDGNSLLYLKNHYFPREVTFQEFVIDFNEAIPVNTDMGTVYIFTDDTSVGPLIGTVRTSQANTTTFKITYPTLNTRLLQVRYISSSNVGIVRMMMFYNDKQ